MIFEYRFPGTDEIKQLSVLFRTVYIETYGTEGVSKEFANFIQDQFSTEKIAERLTSSSCYLQVALYKDNLVGAIQVDLDKSCPIGDLLAPEVNKLYVLRRFFGNGIGRKLMANAEVYLRRLQKQVVWLWVLESNKRAVEFYGRCGYQDIGDAYFQMEVNRYKNKVMKKKLC